MVLIRKEIVAAFDIFVRHVYHFFPKYINKYTEE